MNFTQTSQNRLAPNEITRDNSAHSDNLEGLDTNASSWGDYPLDDLLIRNETRTVGDIYRRIEKKGYVMTPDFQRDFIWDDSKQSKLIESVIMRIPLPVFYLAEDSEGRMIVVDGLQRLSTFVRLMKNEFRLKLPHRKELHGLRFNQLSPKLQNRIEDCNLIMYIIDSRAPEQARLDIFERVNAGEPLSRQQMRNCLYMGKATQFLKQESQTELFITATGDSLNTKNMRDREFVNRFCAFQILDKNCYNGDMDEFLADALKTMNGWDVKLLLELSETFKRTLQNNSFLFGIHAFRKYNSLDDTARNVLNASLWDVLSTGLAAYSKSRVATFAEDIRSTVRQLLDDEQFFTAISYSTNSVKNVQTRFSLCHNALREVLGDHPD